MSSKMLNRITNIVRTRVNRRAQWYPYTAASNNLRCIFIHIPKSAGTSIRQMIGEPTRGRLHVPWWVYRDADPRKFKEYYKFAFVRDPLDRLISGYNYLCDGGNQRDDAEIAHFISEFTDFEDFVNNGLRGSMLITHQIFRPQSFYVCDWFGRLQVDFVGKLENMENDLKIVGSALGFSSDLVHINASQSTAEKSNLSDAIREKVYDIYKSDYEAFGYKRKVG